MTVQNAKEEIASEYSKNPLIKILGNHILRNHRLIFLLFLLLSVRNLAGCFMIGFLFSFQGHKNKQTNKMSSDKAQSHIQGKIV